MDTVQTPEKRRNELERSLPPGHVVSLRPALAFLPACPPAQLVQRSRIGKRDDRPSTSALGPLWGPFLATA
eukprot:11523936-Alexandrium_andersonii.AAC.1